VNANHANVIRPPPLAVDPSATRVLVITRDDRFHAAYAPLFEAEGVEVVSTTSSEALGRLRSDNSFDLVLIDAATQHRQFLELCRRIKQDQDLYLLPVVILLDQNQAVLRKIALRWGADDCVTVPEQNDELLHRCKNLIRTKQATDVLENSEKVIFALARVIEGRDRYTQGHVERVSTYSVQLGHGLGLTDADIVALKRGGILHDVGKIAVSDAILNKPGALDTEGEWTAIRRHPVVGYDLLAPLRTFEPVLPIVRWHHERPNGTGYPDGIGGDELPLVARIVAVADCFDALTTTRPYHEAISVDGSLDILTEGAERGDLDANVVALFRELCSQGIAT